MSKQAAFKIISFANIETSPSAGLVIHPERIDAPASRDDAKHFGLVIRGEECGPISIAHDVLLKF